MTLKCFRNVLRKRQRFNEIKTNEAVEICKKMVLKEIEKYFEQKERTINCFSSGSYVECAEN